MTQFTKLEKAVMEKLLGGNHPVLEALRSQMRSASIKERKQTGTGFYLQFKLPRNAIRTSIKENSFHFGDVVATIPGLNNGAGFVLLITNGLLDSLEGYAFEEEWPSMIDTFELHFTDTNRRNLQDILG
jgi:hypothetical protein